MKQFLINVPEGMLELWREEAEERGVALAALIRNAVNRDIAQPEAPQAEKLFDLEEEEELLEDGWEM